MASDRITQPLYQMRMCIAWDPIWHCTRLISTIVAEVWNTRTGEEIHNVVEWGEGWVKRAWADPIKGETTAVIRCEYEFRVPMRLAGK